MPEEELYKPIEDMFANEGYLSISSRRRLPTERVHSAFGVEVHGATKKIDVVAFKWGSDGGSRQKLSNASPEEVGRPQVQRWDKPQHIKDSFHACTWLVRPPKRT
jgi:hypothetical protein